MIIDVTANLYSDMLIFNDSKPEARHREFRRESTFGRLRVIAAAIAALLALAVPAAAAEPDVPARPQRVAVFDPASLDTLDALGVDVAGVPGSNLPPYLARYADARHSKVGTLFEPDYEAVAALAPDLILIGPRMAAKQRDLAALAPTLDMSIDDRHFLAGAEQNIDRLGRLFGKAEAADALKARLMAATDQVKALAPEAGTVLIVMVNGGKLTAYGPGSRFGWVHDDLGVRPAVPGVQAATHGEVISFELILKTDPDWLFVLDRDAAVGHAGTAARKVMDNDIIAATRAAKAGRILYLDPQRWYITSGGGAALATIAETLADAFSQGRAP